MSDTFIVKGNNKFSPILTEKKWSCITDCVILTDGHIGDNDGLVPNVIGASDPYISELVAKSTGTMVRRSNVRRLGKEGAI